MASLTQSQQYDHYALDLTASQQCIRLFDILPDQHDGVLRCSLLPEKQVSLTDDTRQSYIAISYECGDPASTQHPIMIDDKCFKVLYNLYALLVNLQTRYPDGIPNIWIDAISIDQTNLAEKNHQVQLLKAIYKEVHHVLCWLGPAESESDKVFDLLNEASISLQHDRSAADSLRSVARADWSNLQHMLRDAGAKIKFSFAALTRRGYWTRTWIIQEILLARRVSILCGSRSLEWEVFMMAIEPVISQRTLFDDRTSLIGAASAVVQITKSWLEHVEGTLSDNIVALVGRFAPSHCTLQHDRVYAILGLASDGFSCVVDYSMPFSELLFDLISRYITTPYGMIILYRAFGLSDKGFIRLLHLQVFGDTGHDSHTPCLRIPQNYIFGITMKDNPGGSAHDRKSFTYSFIKCATKFWETFELPLAKALANETVWVHVWPHPSEVRTLLLFEKNASATYIGTLIIPRCLLFFDSDIQEQKSFAHRKCHTMSDSTHDPYANSDPQPSGESILLDGIYHPSPRVLHKGFLV